MTLIDGILDKARRNLRRIVFPESTEPRTLRAVSRLAREAIVRPVLVGPEAAVTAAAREHGVDLANVAIEDPRRSPRRAEYVDDVERLLRKKSVTRDQVEGMLDDPIYFAAAMVRCGDADGSVAGAEHTTADTLRAALRIIRPAPDAKIVSSLFLMVLREPTAAGDDVLAFADCALVPYPNGEELADIAMQTAKNFRALTGRDPRVALLSFSTRGSAEHEAVDKVRSARDILTAAAPELIMDGEMQLDAAIVPKVGASKAPGSPVAGRANVLVFPNLDAGNIGYKLVQRLAGAEAIGPVLQGLNKPANDLSRGCSEQDVVLTAAVTALQCAAGVSAPAGRGALDERF
jgi:phosphate acetyltransferase